MRLAHHTLILASVLSLAACSPAADAPTPKSAEVPTNAAATAPSSATSAKCPP